MVTETQTINNASGSSVSFTNERADPSRTALVIVSSSTGAAVNFALQTRGRSDLPWVPLPEVINGNNSGLGTGAYRVPSVAEIQITLGVTVATGVTTVTWSV